MLLSNIGRFFLVMHVKVDGWHASDSVAMDLLQPSMPIKEESNFVRMTFTILF